MRGSEQLRPCPASPATVILPEVTMATVPAVGTSLLRAAGLRAGSLHCPGVLGVLPGPGQVRFRRPNIQKPLRPSVFRQKLLAISRPVYDDMETIEELPDNCELAVRLEERKEWMEHINQLERFYVEEMLEQFRSSKMIAFFHTNPIKAADWRRAWQVSWKSSR